jgi:putative Holliday junction resolvase
MRRLGVDPGSVRTGVAVADDELGVATPLVTLKHASQADALAQLAKVVTEQEVGEIVIGLPLAMDGREGEAARRARRFASEVTARCGVPVVLWDERLSSASAERALRAQGKKGEARRGVVDQAAATLLLQSYLDSQRDRRWDEDSAQANDEPSPAPERARPKRPR